MLIDIINRNSKKCALNVMVNNEESREVKWCVDVKINAALWEVGVTKFKFTLLKNSNTISQAFLMSY